MKGKTRRKIRRFLGIPLTIVGVVFTIGGLFAASLQHLVSPTAVSLQYFPVWVLLTIFWLIVLVILVLISWILLYIYSKVSTSEIKYFEETNFGKPDENTIHKAIDGILNTEKVEPFYVHAAPRSKEIETVYLRLKEIGFAVISGGPGEGKSMVAYHATYKFQEEDRYCVFRLMVELLGDKMGEEITDELLSQLDNLKGKRKLIIVDDAHKLAIKQDLNVILQQEAKEGHGKYVWVETEFYEEEQKGIQLDTCTRVDFQEFFEKLLKDFYQSQKPILNKALKGHIEGLDDAVERVREGKIRDAWHFAFVASRGEDRLSQNIKDLRSKLKLLVLFHISSYTVLSGESELSSNYLLNSFEDIKFGWLTDALRRSSFSDAIGSLHEQTQDRKSMIRIYDKSESDRGYIASLHYNFARAVVRASLRSSLVEDLLSSTRELLTSEYRKCIYIGVFHRDIGSYAADFDSKNKSWLISFVNNLLPEWLQCYPPLLRGIKSADKDICDEIIRKLDIDGIAEKVSEAKVGQFQQIAGLLNALGDRRDELITELDLAALAKATGTAEVGQFEQLAHLLNALGDRRDELITEFDLAALAKATGTAEVGQFDQLAHLLNALGDRRDELITEFDLVALAKATGTAEVGQFQQIASLLNALGDRRDELITEFDLAALAKATGTAEVGQFHQIASLLNALGDRRDELITEFDLAALAKASVTAEVGQFEQIAGLLNALGDRRDELITEFDLAALAKATGTAEVGQFEQIAGLLNALGDRRDELITEFDLAALAKATGTAEVGQFEQIAGLLNALGDRRDELITEFDLAALAKATGTAEVGQFEQLRSLLNALKGQRESFIDQLMAEDILNELAGTISTAPPNRFQDIVYLLDSLGSRKIHLTPLLNYDKLIEKANEVSLDDIRGLTSLMARLDDANRNKLIQEVDWTSLSMMCPIKAGLLRALGGCLENLCTQAEMLNKSGFNKIAQYLQNHEDEIIEQIENAYEQAKMHGPSYASLYAGVGKFLWNCNQIDHTLSLEIATKMMSGLIERFWIAPINYHYVGQLINALYEIDPYLSESFMGNNKVRGRIQQSINEHDWSKEVEGLKHLIEAFYRSYPDLWRRMLNSNWIVVDLSSLDLDSIYRDVEEEKNAGTTYNTA